MRRLLSPAAAVASCAQPRSTSHGPSSPSPAEPSSRDAGNPAAGGALGSGAGGVLPMHPAAYTHVLLVHNAGQVRGAMQMMCRFALAAAGQVLA